MLALGLFNSSFLNGLNVSTILFEVCIVILLSRVTRRLYLTYAILSSLFYRGKLSVNHLCILPPFYMDIYPDICPDKSISAIFLFQQPHTELVFPSSSIPPCLPVKPYQYLPQYNRIQVMEVHGIVL